MTGGGANGLELVPARSLLEQDVVVRVRLGPGDRVHVAQGDVVASGTRLVDRLRDATIREGGRVGRNARGGRPGEGPRPGSPWPERGVGPGDGPAGARGEHLFEVGGRWRVVAGELRDTVGAPVGGRVAELRPGIQLSLETGARGIRAAEVLGGPASGRLAIAAAAGGEVRASSIDVGRAGTILVAGARIDAEALTRARAMGIRGIIVGGLPSKERRDFLASEARQRASRQALPPFAVLILDGTMRRPIPSPLMAILEALDGQAVGIVDTPPALVIDEAGAPLSLPVPDPTLVRVRAGVLAGAEGRWAGLAGRRRFPGGMDLEAGLVELESGELVTVPLWDLERFS